MRSQRSFSGRCFHGGMGPLPFDILQKSTPSGSAFTFADVQSAGLGVSAAAATPSPLPEAPWQVTQFVSADFLPAAALPAPFRVLYLASSHSFQVSWAEASVAPAPTTSAAAAKAAVRVLPTMPMRSPSFVMSFTTFNTRTTRQVNALFRAAAEGVGHVFDRGELDARPPGPAPRGDFQLVEPAPVPVGEAERLARAEQRVPRLRLRRFGPKEPARRAVFHHAG